MTIVMPDDVQVLLYNIATGLRESLPEVITTALVVVVFVAALIVYSVRHERADRDARRSLYESRYRRRLLALDLPTGSSVLLDRLAAYLRDPSKRFLLLESGATFDSCVRKLCEREHVSPALVAALRLKLGFRVRGREKTPLSSGDIAEESSVLVELSSAHGERQGNRRGNGADEGARRLAARVVAVDAGSLTLEVANDGDVRQGEEVRLFFANAAGLHMVRTRVIARRENLIRVSHSTSIRSLQRRSYYRRQLTAPVFIRRVDGKERFIKTLVQDLGGGGARLINPHDMFESDEKVEVVLDLGLRRRLKVAATIVRANRDGTVSLKFDALRESSRDLILRALFRRYNAVLRHERLEALMER